MSFPIRVESNDDEFVASLVGASDVRVVRTTRPQAIAALKTEIQELIDHGKLESLEMETVGISSLAGRYSDNPTLSDICDQALQMRDAELNS